MRNSFKVMHDELHTVKVRISPEWARWVGEKVWRGSQKALWSRGYGFGLGTLDSQLGTLFKVAWTVSVEAGQDPQVHAESRSRNTHGVGVGYTWVDGESGEREVAMGRTASD